jgi:hypothetical protein
VYETVKSFNVSLSTVKNWFEKYPYLQIKQGVDYTLVQHKKGKINDVASYLQKMVSAIDITDKQEKVKTEKKVKLEQQKLDKEEQTLFGHQATQIKNDYFIGKKDLAKRLLEANPNLFTQIMEELKGESQTDKNNLLAELALNNYKPLLGIQHNSLEEFVGNFNVDGTFQSYVLAKMTPMFNDFQILRDEFTSKAKQLGIKDIELF